MGSEKEKTRQLLLNIIKSIRDMRKIQGAVLNVAYNSLKIQDLNFSSKKVENYSKFMSFEQ